MRDELKPIKARKDALQKEQLPAWFAEVGKLPPITSAYLRFLLLTGARRGEASELRWRDVDFTWQTLVLGDKVEETRTIPLTPYVGEMLRDLPRRNEWVFSSRSASGHIENIHAEHVEAQQRAKLRGLTIHGLRRSFKSLSEWVELPVGIVAQIMGHKPSATAEKHYTVRPLDLLRRWHTKLEGWILEQAHLEVSTDVED